MAEKKTPVTDKLQAMNVPITVINEKITELENDLRKDRRYCNNTNKRLHNLKQKQMLFSVLFKRVKN